MRAAAAGLLTLPLLLSMGVAAFADDGRPSQTVARATDLPPRRATEKELVLLIGGLGSHPADGTWEALVARYEDDPRYEVRHFGADPRIPYDTTGDIEANAERLVTQIRSVAPRYSAVHIVAHSMGGVVADSAFASGLSSADRVHSYIALASPHNGAIAARAITNTVAMAGREGELLRRIAAEVTVDPGSAAAFDLARRPTPVAPPGVVRLDLRLATDLLVLDRDARLQDVDSRVLLPSSLATLEGHGGILKDVRALDLVTSTIARGATSDARAASLREAADIVSDTTGELALVGLTVTMLAALLAAWKLRQMRGLLDLGAFRRRASS